MVLGDRGKANHCKERQMKMKIHGSFITDHVRDLWAEREFVRAFSALDCMEGLTREQQEGILFGRYKLTGINSFDLEPDTWTPPDEYLSFFDALRQGQSYGELETYREGDAYKKMDEAAFLTLCGNRGEDATRLNNLKRAARKLVGEVMADQFLDQCIAAIGEAERTRVDPKSWLPDGPPRNGRAVSTLEAMAENVRAKMAAAGIKDVPTADALLNRGSKLVPKLCPNMSSVCGWLLPNGDYFGCGPMEHIGLAGTLLESQLAVEGGAVDAETYAESLGWAKITSAYRAKHTKKLTRKQETRLWDYAELHGKDYKTISMFMEL